MLRGQTLVALPQTLEAVLDDTPVPRCVANTTRRVTFKGCIMTSFLLNNSIFIVFAITASILGISEYRRYLRRTGKTPKEVQLSLRERLNEVGNELLAKLLVSVIVTLVISIISFRELWMNDTFHIVFLTNLLSKPTYRYLKSLVK